MANTHFHFYDRMSRKPQKTLSATELWNKYSVIRLMVDDIGWSGVATYAYKYLPAAFLKDRANGNLPGREAVVIPKGTVMSLVTASTDIVASGGIPFPNQSGTIPVGLEADGDAVTAPIDWSFYGYPDTIAALWVPCNGGAQATYPYTTLDDTIGLWNRSTNTPLVIGANIPVACADRDIQMDIRGAYLNYQTQDVVPGFAVGRMNVPFVDTTKFQTLTSAAFGGPSDVPSNPTRPYVVLSRLCQFIYFADAGYARAGALIKSDLYGKLIPQYTSNIVTAAKNVQTVGYVQYLDSRFPKDLSNMVQNYPGIENALGVNTKGLPVDLYMFVVTAIEAATGTTPTAQDCLDAVQSGVFGYARVQISIGR